MGQPLQDLGDFNNKMGGQNIPAPTQLHGLTVESVPDIRGHLLQVITSYSKKSASTIRSERMRFLKVCANRKISKPKIICSC